LAKKILFHIFSEIFIERSHGSFYRFSWYRIRIYAFKTKHKSRKHENAFYLPLQLRNSLPVHCQPYRAIKRTDLGPVQVQKGSCNFHCPHGKSVHHISERGRETSIQDQVQNKGGSVSTV